MVVNSTATPREDAGESSQERWRKIQEVHPTLAEAGRFIDWQKYRLGRLQSAMRTEFKKSAMEQRK
jgi:hypothetical protein